MSVARLVPALRPVRGRARDHGAFPQVTRVIPGLLVFIAVLTAMTVAAGITVPTVGDKGSSPTSLPKLVDDITDTRWNKTREMIGQGIVNVVTGVFGVMGGCGWPMTSL